jgi:hypothetical protein
LCHKINTLYFLFRFKKSRKGAVYKTGTAIRLKPHFSPKKAHRRRTKSKSLPLANTFELPDLAFKKIKISQPFGCPDFPGIYYPHSQLDHLSGNSLR